MNYTELFAKARTKADEALAAAQDGRLEDHETLMAAAGDTVENILMEASDRYAGEFFCVVEGAIPTAQNGVFGMIGGRTMLSIAQDICPKAKTWCW